MHKNVLTEIKKGQTGTGLLIEHDGYASFDMESNKPLMESIKLNEENGQIKLPKPFIVSAVFQKFGIENANGRVYPEDILKREVENYQQAVKERRAYGECYTPDAMCLTKKGWKPISEVKIGDIVATLNTNTNQSEFQKVTYITEHDWDGELIHIKGDLIDDFVTPTHGFPIYEMFSDDNEITYPKFKAFKTAEELMEDSNNNVENLLPINIYKEICETYNLSKAKYNKEHYNGKVYCIEVPNHVWLVKQNGKKHWTKNCNHPDESSIDLSRLAMNIVELHWEGHTLVGKMEIPISEGFRNLGIISSCADTVAQWLISGLKIGVSSRALGSVQQMGDKLIVGDDLELICWDIVANPSTPGANIAMNDDELQKYVESKKNNKPVIKEDKFSKFDAWLNN